MANDLPTLRQRLATQLRDETDVTWPTEEKDYLIGLAVRNLSPRIMRALDPEGASCTQALTSADYIYALNTAIIHLARVDWIDSSGNERGPLTPGTWEVMGDPAEGTGKIHVSPTIVEAGGTLRYHAWGRYDTVTNLIPDDHVPLVLAEARHEAYRRIGADRERFKQWINKNQVQNVSLNELLQLVSDARREADDQRAVRKTWTKPVPARV